MSSFAWMKVLESAPERYDRGIRLLSRGRIHDVHERIARRVAGPGRRVLDLGCGTGAVALACAARGAAVVGIDRDAGMLAVARAKPVPLAGRVEWVQLGMAELEDRFAPASFDAAVACLSFSELSAAERAYALGSVHRLLVPGGLLVVADETVPRGRARRALHRLLRWPQELLVYMLTQATTRPVSGLAAALSDAGFLDVEETRLWSDTFAVVEGRTPGAAA